MADNDTSLKNPYSNNKFSMYDSDVQSVDENDGEYEFDPHCDTQSGDRNNGDYEFDPHCDTQRPDKNDDDIELANNGYEVNKNKNQNANDQHADTDIFEEGSGQHLDNGANDQENSHEIEIEKNNEYVNEEKNNTADIKHYVSSDQLVPDKGLPLTNSTSKLHLLTGFSKLLNITAFNVETTISTVDQFTPIIESNSYNNLKPIALLPSTNIIYPPNNEINVSSTENPTTQNNNSNSDPSLGPPDDEEDLPISDSILNIEEDDNNVQHHQQHQQQQQQEQQQEQPTLQIKEQEYQIQQLKIEEFLGGLLFLQSLQPQVGHREFQREIKKEECQLLQQSFLPNDLLTFNNHLGNVDQHLVGCRGHIVSLLEETSWILYNRFLNTGTKIKVGTTLRDIFKKGETPYREDPKDYDNLFKELIIIFQKEMCISINYIYTKELNPFLFKQTNFNVDTKFKDSFAMYEIYNFASSPDIVLRDFVCFFENILKDLNIYQKQIRKLGNYGSEIVRLMDPYKAINNRIDGLKLAIELAKNYT